MNVSIAVYAPLSRLCDTVYSVTHAEVLVEDEGPGPCVTTPPNRTTLNASMIMYTLLESMDVYEEHQALGLSNCG